MISIIISFYKRRDFLDLILQALEKQSYRKFEVVLAEDDNAEETLSFLKEARAKYSYPIKHVSQEDEGFRKNKILNAAVLAADGEQLVFLDGDCIPHRHLLKVYTKAVQENRICYGRRVYLSEKITSRILGEHNIKRLNFFNALLAGSTSMGAAVYNPFQKNIDKQHRDILGCNWGILRKHVLEVNGFDEDYTRASVGEDLDIGWRLKGQGLRMKSMKNKAIVYHLFHHSSYNSNDTELMFGLMREKVEVGNTYCLNGICKPL